MIYPISWSYAAPYLLTALAGGYLLGAIPFGLLLARLFGGGDIRRLGSGNIGATNVLRAGHRGLAALTLLLDAGKGAAAAALGQRYGPDMAVVAALGAFLGHLFPVWLRFRGGKGVATALGITLVFSWQTALAATALWGAVVAATRYASLGALAATAATPFLAAAFATRQATEFLALICVLIWLRHAGNIVRLAKGTESRIGRGGGPDGG